MNIGDKLTYSRSWQRIYFFKEGVFVQLYGVSLYLAVTHLNLSAKVHHYRHKARDYQTILRAGIPEKSLTSLVNGELIKCDYGYQLIVNQPQNLAGYQNWYKSMLAKLRVINEVNNISLNSDVKYVNGEPWVKLSNSEYQFLQTWQVGQRQQDAELRFFAGLRKKIAPSNA